MKVVLALGVAWPSSATCSPWRSSATRAMGAQCQRGHQGLVAVYGGSPVQWDSRQQPFCVLSTTESELLSYCDGLVLGDSISSIVEILENNQLCEKGERVHGDSMSGLKLLEAPDGP